MFYGSLIIVFLLVGKLNSRSATQNDDHQQFNNTEEDSSLDVKQNDNIQRSNNIEEDSSLDVFSLIRKYDYPAQIHRVITEDGYILEMHRIPHGRDGSASSDEPRKVVFLMHGILASSADWILTGPDNGFAYLLAEQGYDVWMGNARGNTYSRKHTSLNPKYSNFWDFSWHEIGIYDLPAMIDYVLLETGQPRLHYVGFSQGTTTFFVMASRKPEYNSKIISMQALAPIAFVSDMRSPFIKFLAPFSDAVNLVAKMLGIGELLANNDILTWAGRELCQESIFKSLCTNMLFLIVGFSTDQLNTTTLPLVLAHTPAGASVKQVVHYGQNKNSETFRQFDYGFIRNIFKYGSRKPPEYDLASVTVPVALHYSENDWMAHVQNVDQLYEKLKNPLGKFRVPLKSFNHLDFMFAIDVKTLIYDRVINLLNAFK